jgi:hypothetical protein
LQKREHPSQLRNWSQAKVCAGGILA